MTTLVSRLLTMYNTALDNSVPTQWGGHEYLTPKEGSDTSKDSIYDAESGVTEGSLPGNYHPAATTHRDHAGYQNSVWGYNSQPLNNLQNIHNICKDNQTETETEMLENKDPTPGLSSCRISTESGYCTTRSSVESEKGRVLSKCRYGPHHDELLCNGEGTEEHL